jgi:predicted Zn-dependent peptidase
MAVDQALYRRTVLPNRLTVITEPMDYVRTVALGVWVAAGSRFEDATRNGISHFIEHMLFKGTAHRSARGIAEALDAIGGQLNAFTDKEHTCY